MTCGPEDTIQFHRTSSNPLSLNQLPALLATGMHFNNVTSRDQQRDVTRYSPHNTSAMHTLERFNKKPIYKPFYTPLSLLIVCKTRRYNTSSCLSSVTIHQIVGLIPFVCDGASAFYALLPSQYHTFCFLGRGNG